MVTRRLPGGAGLPSTVSWKRLVAVANPSLTMTAMLATPVCPMIGVTVTKRLLELPLKTTPLSGTRAGLSEVADNVRLEAGVWGSPMVKGRAGVALLTAIARFVRPVMVGGESTLTVKEREIVLLLVPPLFTVTVIEAEPN